MKKKIIYISSILLSFHLYAAAQVPNIPIPVSLLPKSMVADTAKKPTPPAPDPRKLIKPYKEVISPDFTTRKGLFTVHQHADTFYFELPKQILGRDMQVVSRLVNGIGGSGVYSGEELNNQTVRWEKSDIDSSIRLINVLVIGTADKSDKIYRTVKSSYSDAILQVFPIKAYSPDSSAYVIDISQYMRTGGNAGNLFNEITNEQMGKVLDNRNFRDFLVESVQTFPMNVEIRMVKTSASRGIQAVGLNVQMPTTISTNTSFILLPEVPMAQRAQDIRVGYFADMSMHFADQQQAMEMRTFIRRWRLEPKPGDVEKYKKGVLVEPAKQIVIYIDPATPKQWRPYLIAGVNDWQKAFEQAGFKNAIVGKEWPNEDSVDYYINDARYSFIRYLPSEAMNAYGPVVYDPRSGEILQTHIGWYHNVMKLLRNWYFIQAAPLDPAARKPVFDEKLMGQLIRFVSSHEVGHTLGLLHNFGASSRTPVDSLRNKQYLAKYGHTSSIMDYARFNYVAQPEDNIPRELLFPGIGEYDKWAIEWGYKFSTDDYVTNKKKNFQLVTNRLANNSRLWFGDGESRQNDPRAQTEDLGDNSMKANAYGIKNLQRIMANLEEWTKEENGDYTFMREIHREVERQFTRYITHVFRNIDGFYTTPRAESNGGDMFEPSPKEKVREALAFLDEQLFTTPTWLVNKAIVNKTSVPNFESFVYDIQIKGMNAMLDIGTMNTILANGEQFKGKAINIEEYINIAHGMIWRDLKNGEVKDIYRRNLQKSYIGSLQNVLLSNIPVNTETDVYSLAKADMKQVKQEIEQALPLAKDNLTKIHLEDLLDRIKKVLEAKP